MGYIIIAAPHQDPESSLSDLLFLARRRVLAGVSVFYPVPGSIDFEQCKSLGILPGHLSCMRSSALPIEHTTTRLETVTLLRLGRILNFIKSLIQGEASVGDIAAGKIKFESSSDRINTGLELLRLFIDDGRIRGVGPQGDIFEHQVSAQLTKDFIDRIKSMRIRGCV